MWTTFVKEVLCYITHPETLIYGLKLSLFLVSIPWIVTMTLFIYEQIKSPRNIGKQIPQILGAIILVLLLVVGMWNFKGILWPMPTCGWVDIIKEKSLSLNIAII